MAADEMDYNIVFPDAGTSERYWSGTKQPVVVLLGWAGCRDRLLCKYGRIYSDQGCVTVRYTAPLRTVFVSESFGYAELRGAAVRLLDVLFDYEVDSAPVLFHVFSNGGFMLYRYVVELLSRDRRFASLAVVGAVVDSAPGGGNVRGALRALAATLGPRVGPVLRCALLALFAVGVLVLRVVLYPLTRLLHKNHYEAVRDAPPAWPHLLLYSRADRVIRHRDVERFMEALRGGGVPVDGLDFVSSQHVSHFRDFPQQYSLRCRRFLRACLTAAEGGGL